MAKSIRLQTLPILPPSAIVGCAQCAFREPCGGMDGQQTFWGCFEACATECSAESSCDLACPRRPDYIDLLREVGGLRAPAGPVRPLTHPNLPLYIPMIRHGFDRHHCVSTPFVALSIRDVLKMDSRGRYRPVAGSGAELRERFGLRPDAMVLVVSVAPDEYIERYWRFRRRDDTPTAIAALELAGMTAPNYSFFERVPRTHTLRNRARMLRVAEELSYAGVKTVLHLNAEVPADWRYWTALLKEHTNIRYISKEFQTGLKVRSKGQAQIVAMRRLQDDIGRALHPIVVGGMAYVRLLQSGFPHGFTLVDSTPFLKTMSRHKRVQRGESFVWEKHPTAHGAPLDELLEDNIKKHVAHIKKLVPGKDMGVAA